MKGAEYLINALQEAGTDTIFGYPGGAIMPVYDAIYDSSIRHILCRHEQGAALAADGFARSSGRLGVCLGTSGPGATNLLTGIANAYLDSVPLLAITGQVASPVMGTDAFQEVDILGMSLPVVKHSFLVQSVDDLPRILQQAIDIATSGRPGPVLIDIPKDIQLAEFDPTPYNGPDTELLRASDDDLQQAREMIMSSQQPVLYSGGGVVLAGAVEALRNFAKSSQIPSVTTLKGIGNQLNDEPYHLGMLGMHGTRAANLAVHECDLLIAVGARFDDRVTGKLDEFAPNAKVIHLDIDAAEMGKLRRPDLPLQGELKYSLQQLECFPGIDPWREQCAELKQKHRWRYDHPGPGIWAPKLIKELAELSSQEQIISCDVGQHQMWIAQHYPASHPSRHLSSSGLGTMGYGLPAAIGAQFANPDCSVINVCGDGSFMMNIQELATLKRYNLPVKILLLDNQRLGMVRQWQELFFTERYSETDLSDNPDFVAVARAFGIESRHIDRADQVSTALDEMLQSDSSFLLHVSINPQENVWPLVPPGVSNTQMMEQNYESF
ncbi:acetolactate synthase 2 catalytic subunit [Aestuariirhabdus sp. Z084]|uniref:acetolactate synthase 2 catalytic subunit n=1 Tax=Aestuariirhabdus haliotis TaxID=2918751 RepID=UPI00201B4104|nr:acetolactate synthase 2 catalytic subunit [Aestuariirhabdus haliotis]MCL6415464.1 acetolactate synthase 2 catalytic subunit [Aestuariirhabdus haliotis]MCL6419331.1 acetolactate synthase 2 catalytic subunit [Aestuariirhabdus haliotis]